MLDRWGQIDILVNNAGCSWGAPAEDHPDDGWNKVMNLNVDAQFFLCREVGKRSMLPRKSGKIINIASIAGLYGNPPEWALQTIAYNTSKGALVNMTRALAAEWGRHNINVNAICPGFFPSKMSKVTLDRIGASVVALTPLGRLGGDEDLKGRRGLSRVRGLAPRHGPDAGGRRRLHGDLAVPPRDRHLTAPA